MCQLDRLARRCRAGTAHQEPAQRVVGRAHPGRIAILAVSVVFFLARAAYAQPAVDRVERRIRELTKDADDADIGYLGVVADDSTTKGTGVELVEVHDASPAATSRLEPGDLVTKIGDKPIRSLDDFAAALVDQPVGKALRFTIERGGKPLAVEVKLGRRPPVAERRFPTFGPIGEPDPLRTAQLGVRVDACDEKAATRAGAPAASGALVIGVAAGSPAAAAGIPPQAVIVAVDGNDIASPDDLKKLIAKARPGQEVKVDFYSRGELLERNVRLAEARPLAPVAGLGAEPPEPGGEALSDRQRIERLERRVRELEARIAEFERFLGGRPN